MLARIILAFVVFYAAYFLIGGFAAPLLAHWHYGEWADYFYGVFANSCQQQPSRTFWLLGYPMALCARCTGIYLGFVATGMLTFCRKIPMPGFRLWIGLLLLALLEKASEWWVWESINPIRFISGVLLGFVLLTGLAKLLTVKWRLSRTHEH